MVAANTTKKSAEMTEFFIQDIPKAVKTRFKAYCAARGLPMKSVLIDFMKKCIEDDTNDHDSRRLTPKRSGVSKRGTSPL